MRQTRILSLALGVVLSVMTWPSPAAADPIVITGGSLAVFSQIDLPTFRLCTRPDCSVVTSADSVFQGVLGTNAQELFNAGQLVTPFGAGGAITPSTGLLTEVVNGTTYQAILTGSLIGTAAPFVAPPPSGPSFSITTPYTMQGHISGFADPFQRVALFSVDVTGSGTETISGQTFGSGVPADYFAREYLAVFAPTPEPATVLLLATGIVAMLWRCRFRELFLSCLQFGPPGFLSIRDRLAGFR